MLILHTCNLLKGLVGAPGFEPGTSCAQGRTGYLLETTYFQLLTDQ
jgi:hypothetical protein